jgi:hypothetical protein
MHAVETTTSEYICDGSQIIRTVTTDGTSTAAAPAGTVWVSPTSASIVSEKYDEYTIYFTLPSEARTFLATITETATVVGNCPGNPSTETRTDERWISYWDFTTATVDTTGTAHLKSTKTYDHDANTHDTVTVDLTGCGEALGTNWVDRFPIPYITNGKVNEKKALAALSSKFRSKALSFISVLRQAGATVKVTTTTRPQARAYLMAKSLAIAQGKVDPEDVATYPGTDASGRAVKGDGAVVPICWVNRDENGAVDETQTKTLALNMVNAYRIKGASAYPTEHMKGTAIDLDITWPKNKALQIYEGPYAAQRTLITIKGRRDGANPLLWKLGQTYGVIKGPPGKDSKGKDMRIVDYPHWSVNGK